MPKSLRDAAAYLRVDRAWLRGYCEGKGYRLTPFKKCLCLSPADLRSIEKYLRQRKAAA